MVGVLDLLECKWINERVQKYRLVYLGLTILLTMLVVSLHRNLIKLRQAYHEGLLD